MKRHSSAVIAASVCLQLTFAAAAAGQAAVGAGPLTRSLADSEPTIGVLSVGPVRLAPGIVVREIGTDSNVFDEAVDPKEDFVIRVAPDVALFTKLRWVQLSAYGGGDFNYFNTYDQENSAGYQMRGRADFLLSRVRPFVAGGRLNLRERPNGEIDVRADRMEDEISGGLAFDISRYGVIYGAAYQHRTRYEDAFEDGVNLALALNQNSYEYSGGLRTELTPLLAFILSGGIRDDRFESDPIRNAETTFIGGEFRFAPEAIVAGTASVSYNDFRPVNPAVRTFKGLLGSANLMYRFLEMGRINFQAVRRNEYSFEESDAYYIENSFSLSYTHMLFSEVDVQIIGTKSLFDYGYTETSPAREDTYDLLGGSLGYNLRNRTRISLNYEYSRRRSPQLAERNYDRRRVFLAWMFAY
jgi:hypothetical protein